MLRRLITIAVVFALAFILLALNNKVFVGTQELQAFVAEVPGKDHTFEVVFKDVAGNRVAPNADEQAAVQRRLEKTPDRELIKTTAMVPASADHGLLLTLDPKESVEALRGRLQGRPFQRANPTRDLFHITKGIDLRGGVEFVCRLYNDDGKSVSADEETIGILRNRLDERGLTEPQVLRLSNGDVQVVIPGGTTADAARTRRVLETTGRLEFREVMPVGTGRNGAYDVYLTVPDLNAADSPVIRTATGAFKWVPGHPQTASFQRGEIVAPEKVSPGEPQTRFFRLGPVALSGKDVADAHTGLSRGQSAVDITFTAIGAGKNEEFTKRVKAKGDSRAGTGQLAILFDNVVQTSPTVHEASSGSCQITGAFTDEEAAALRTVLKGGSLAVTPVVLSQRTVGASLGEQAVSQSMLTMGLSALAIVVFMVLYYRRLGVVANLCLAVTGVLIVATLSVFSATLTLPGLAGLVLTIGMAVDTNILIFERIREELRDDKGLKAAIAAGYDRAFWTIFDAHLTTLLAALILYWIGTGPVKGFGLTLIIGIVINLFSGVYVGRMFTDWLCRRETSLSMANWIGEVKLPYVEWRWYGYVLSVVTGVLAFGYFSFGHLLSGGSFERNFDIDFTGGNMAQVIFSEPLDGKAVDAAIVSAHAGDPQGLALIAPNELRKQAYFGGPNLAGGASREWVFRARDEGGGQLENQRSELDRQRVTMERSLNKLRDAAPEGTRTPEMKDVQAKIDALIPQIAELQHQIGNRAEEFKRQVAKAFPGKIAAEGDELRAAAWDGATLRLELATLSAPESGQAADIAQRLGASTKLPGLVSADAKPLATGNGLALTLTWREPPAPRAEAETIDPLVGRLATLLKTDGIEPQALNARVARALEAYNATVNAAAAAKVTVAKPFPATEHFSGQVAGQMKARAVAAVLLALLAILAYVAMRFEFRFGIGAVVALFHDVLLTIGLISVLGIRIDLNVIAALLTIIGYSINDTIVTFDRIRENLGKLTKPLAEIIDLSIAQTMPRTVLTTGTVVLTVLMLVLFGGEALHAFAATLLIGLIAGTYSSVFVAAPLLLSFKGKLLPPPPTDGAADGSVIPAPATAA